MAQQDTPPAEGLVSELHDRIDQLEHDLQERDSRIEDLRSALAQREQHFATTRIRSST